MKKPRSILSLLSILILINVGSLFATQELQGGLGVFIERPKNPIVRRGRSQNLKSKGLQSAPNTAKGVVGGSSAATSTQPDSGLKEETEDALFLGNSARDAKPPRYEEAERAYKLAIKLSPEDPRPYIGLGNIYYDQKRYDQAAKAYKEALRLADLLSPEQQASLAGGAVVGAVMGAILGGGKGAGIGAVVGSSVSTGRYRMRSALSSWHAYAGNALLHQEQWSEAEAELQKAVGADDSKAQWHAQLGYAFSKQKKYVNAIASYARALELDQENATYMNFLEQSLDELKKAKVRSPK